jgi:hypothetical protein
MAESVECESCHDLSQVTSIEVIDAACMDCHDDEEERFEGMAAGWKSEFEELLRGAEGRSSERDREVLDTLRRAGPLHNPEATRMIIQALRTRPIVSKKTVEPAAAGLDGAESEDAE